MNIISHKDKIIELSMDYIESKGFSFVKNSGAFAALERDGDSTYYWNSDYPFKVFHPIADRSEDFFKDIVSTKKFKKAWSRVCDESLIEIFEEEDKSKYQIKINQPVLNNFEDAVKDFLDNYQSLKISSPMATGKSNIISEVLKQSIEKKLRVLFITPRVSLSYDIYDKYLQVLPNFHHYKNKTYSLDSNLVVQFDSLLNYDMSYFDIVILDESTSLMLYMSDTYEGKEDRFRKNLKNLYLLKDKKFVLADAFILKFPIEFDSCLGILNEYREDIKIIEYIDKHNFTGKIIREAQKQPISISSNEKRFLINMEKKLQKRGLRCLMLNAETINRDVVYKEFEKFEANYDVILYSPTLTVGVSIFNNISNHFHFDLSGTIDVISSIQMIRRVRNAKTIHFYIQGRRSYLPTDIKVIQRHLGDGYKIINEFGESFGINRIGEMLSKIRRIRNNLMNSHKYAFKHLLKYQFKQIELNEIRI